MKKLILCLFLVFITTANLGAQEKPCPADLESNQFQGLRSQLENIGLTVASASWTHDDQYEGKVIIFSAKGHAHSSASNTEGGDKIQYYMARVETEAQVSDEGLEHAYLHVSAITIEKVKELERDGRFHLVEQGVSLGNVQVSRDLPLAQEIYIEAAPVKIYGTIGFSPNKNSNWELLARASASLGYAHARSTKEDVANTNNFYVGQEYGLSVKHRTFGQVDFDRGVDGEAKKYDSSSTSSREAYVRLGYTYHFNDRSSLTFAGEKRSFRFGPDYEKSRHYLLSYQRRFK